MFTSFFKEATAEKRKRLKAKELERASRADEELAAEEKKEKEEKTKKKKKQEEKEEEEGKHEEPQPKRRRKLTSEDVAEVWKKLVSGEILSDEDEDDIPGRKKEEEIAPAFSKEECKVFVGGISDSEDKIRARFGKWGTIKFVSLYITHTYIHLSTFFFLNTGVLRL